MPDPDRTALRERVARALYERMASPELREAEPWGELDATRQGMPRQLADAVLSELASLLDAADGLAEAWEDYTEADHLPPDAGRGPVWEAADRYREARNQSKGEGDG